MEKEIQLNVAYGTARYKTEEENVYDNMPCQDSLNKTVNKPRRTATRSIAGFAVVLASLALLVAVVTAAIYFSTHGVRELNGTSNQDNLQQLVQTLQVELNDSKNEITIFKNQFSSQDSLRSISTLQQMVQALQAKLNESNEESKLIQAKLNDSINAIRSLKHQLNLVFYWIPVRSCSNIPSGSPSGYYWIQTNRTKSPVQIYCDMDRTNCSCNTTRGWMRVANLDMTDPNQNCPAGFRLVNRTSAPLRTCGRPGPEGCVSTTFQTYGVEYSNVCGRVIGYQDQSPDAFKHSATIDSEYVDGVSLTHGQSPRQHIWTFAGARDETRTNPQYSCPCIQEDSAFKIPSFVGQDYFCDTASREALEHMFFPHDPLWDGKGCGGTSTCCEFNNPPWFCKQLLQPTTDDIELRLCGNEATSNEDTPIEQVEIYVY